MAMGKPIVASGFLDGGERIAEWGVGLAFTPGNELELSEALITLLKDKELADQFAEKAVERAKNHHTWAAVAQRIDEQCLQDISKQIERRDKILNPLAHQWQLLPLILPCM